MTNEEILQIVIQYIGDIVVILTAIVTVLKNIQSNKETSEDVKETVKSNVNVKKLCEQNEDLTKNINALSVQIEEQNQEIAKLRKTISKGRE